MEAKVLTIILGLFTAFALLKFAFFFLLPYQRRRAALDKAYRGKRSATKYSDVVFLALSVCLVVLLDIRGVEQVSFLTGLLVGMTLIQLYFHQFFIPLTDDVAPARPVSPIKVMSYAIQAQPSRPWKELAVIACLLLWSLYGAAQVWGN